MVPVGPTCSRGIPPGPAICHVVPAAVLTPASSPSELERSHFHVAVDPLMVSLARRPSGAYAFAAEVGPGTPPATGVSDAVVEPLPYWPFVFAPHAAVVCVTTFDTAGNLTSTTDPLGRTTTMTYNELRQPLTVTRPLTADNEHTVTTTSTYDSAGNLLTASTPLLNSEDEEIDTQTVTVHHDDGTHPGDVTSVDDARDKTWTYTYDTYGNRTSTTDPVGDEATVAYNIAGWPTEQVSPRGNEEGADPGDFTTSFAYNPTGQITSVTDPLDQTTTRTYDENGNLATVTDPNTHMTTYTYDDADRLTEIDRADTSTLANEYTPAGHLAVQRDAAGEPTTYTYDALGRVVSVEDELSRTVEFGYDTAGNETSRQEDGGDCAATPATGCTLFAYDDANQLTGINYSDATPDVSAIGYDGLGRRVAATDGTGSSSWAWDSLGRLVSHTDGTSRTVDYGYDLASNLTSITYPDSIGTITRAYDDAGRWTAVTDWNDNTASFDYDPDGNLTTVAFPTGAGDTDTTTYDPDGRVDTIDFADDTVSYASLDYGRDDLGQITADTPTGLPGASHAYTYDPINRLDTLDTDPYGYDTADNLALLPDGATQQFDIAHQLCFQSPGALSGTCGAPPVDAATYTYDSRGNRTSTQPAGQDPTTYTYDLANRLTTATKPTGDPAEGTWTYSYNSDGLRVTRTNPADTTTNFTWSVAEPLPVVLTETDGTNTHAYIYGPDGLVIEDTDGVTARWYHHDQLGTTRSLTDNTGAPLATYTYDPNGNPDTTTGTDTTPFGYTGQYTDTETGLIYLRTRYYDPTTGQLLARDPLEILTGIPMATCRTTR